MWRERALKIVLVLVGLLFAAAIYPVVMALWHASPSDGTGDTMMLMRKPSAHRSLIAFATWSSFAHAVVMSLSWDSTFRVNAQVSCSARLYLLLLV